MGIYIDLERVQEGFYNVNRDFADNIKDATDKFKQASFCL
ncbi:hypothetical protein PSM36_3088 [Proteiniphilum saccharofermentans]|uniref:Uncharacterized protein n=1 Tax=Proteiniphilum saccharofermentans TaxID=1642647 RepID=A0A1R3TB88_9BACT|nr:hypothetical protein PSM36_3088 [Proteiniphilum saccharofermentans]